MPGTQEVLLLDGLDVRLDQITERLRDLRFVAARAKTADEALALVEGRAFGAVVLPSDLPGPDASAVVGALRARATGQLLTFLAAGPEPAYAQRDALRDAGIAIALWEPLDDAVLRYQMNRALSSVAGRRPRGALRVPCSAPARARTGNREKPGRLYTISEQGLFFETPRASMRGVAVEMELQIAGQVLPAAGRVAVSNVPGNLRNPKLPVGIGVQFESLPKASANAIRQAVASIAPSLDV